MDSDLTEQKFPISLKTKEGGQNESKLKLQDPYFNCKASIWSKISIKYTDEKFLIFVSHASREAYEAIYRLIGLVYTYEVYIRSFYLRKRGISCMMHSCINHKSSRSNTKKSFDCLDKT
mgnify:CR=1 FL=1